MIDEVAKAKQRADTLRQKLQRQSAELPIDSDLKDKAARVIAALDQVSRHLNEAKSTESESRS